MDKLYIGTKRQQNREMLLHKAIWDIVMMKVMELNRIITKPYIGTERQQNREMLLHKIIWDIVIIVVMEYP